MPELPEVESIRRTLIHKRIVKKSVKKLYLPNSRLLRLLHNSHNLFINREQFIHAFTKESIISLERRGKYLMFKGNKYSFILHFGMSGVLHWREHAGPTLPHLYLRLSFVNGEEILFTDPRTFGRIILIKSTPSSSEKTSNQVWQNLGINLGYDAFITSTKKLSRKCWEKTQKSTRPLKSILLDQSILAGVGNIYADESLFYSQFSPLRWGASLEENGWLIIIRNLKKVFRRALQAGGSSLNDYRRPNGLEGNFQSQFVVYGKGGEPCIQCKKPLKKTIVQSRTTVYCSVCQK